MCRSSRRAVRRMPVRVKYALSSSTFVVSSETSEDRAAHHARERDRLVHVADQEIARRSASARRRRGWSGARPRPARRTTIPGPASRSHVEARGAAARARASCSSSRRRRRDRAASRQAVSRACTRERAVAVRVDAADHARDVARAPVGRVEAHGRDVGRRPRRLLERAVGLDERHAGGGRDLARHPEHAQEVRSVRLDLDVEDGVVEAERGARSRRPTPHVLAVQHEDPGVDVGDRRAPAASTACRSTSPRGASSGPSGSGEHGHPRPGLAPTAPDRPPRSSGRPRTRPARRSRRRPWRRRACPSSGGRRPSTHARDDHALDAVPGAEHLLDLHALAGRSARRGRRRPGRSGQNSRSHEQDDPHATPSNCARNRTSPSNSIRMSGIAYFSRATRSIPSPKANPV